MQQHKMHMPNTYAFGREVGVHVNIPVALMTVLGK